MLLNPLSIPAKVTSGLKRAYADLRLSSSQPPQCWEGTLEDLIRQGDPTLYDRFLDSYYAFYQQVAEDYAKDDITYQAPSREDLDARTWACRNTRIILLDFAHFSECGQSSPHVCFIIYSLDVEYSDTVMIESLYVAEPLRRCGIGNFLLDKCIAICKKRLPDKNMKMLIGVGEYNTGAAALYQQKGFTKRTFSYFERKLNK